MRDQRQNSSFAISFLASFINGDRDVFDRIRGG